MHLLEQTRTVFLAQGHHQNGSFLYAGDIFFHIHHPPAPS
ncbi:hypothetical protein NBRC3293_0200 [Gluconobacter oxydans NBRC 3293]|uniref:Uncharacterized protein n=1 Tax=Gluconobacter oxydans NBRC 3293 TaxID=1315969 RepID=A0A829WUV1_GLUOY|nr:hypothetical protein NBRC3293_0200 [Gluconobacter oxydans NBRC 3293]